jgi:hypothetical protein
MIVRQKSEQQNLELKKIEKPLTRHTFVGIYLE